VDGVASERTQEGFADAELLAGMRAGHSAAFAALMRSNNQRLYRLARGFLRDDLEAEEAVHDGYVSAFTHLDGFRGGSSLATWLARIVSNEALAHLLGLIEPHDIANMALYLASDESRMVTGQVLPVDSGVTIS
jgi:DNA-directed RNA polymerase specialized sigma24 family protein